MTAPAPIPVNLITGFLGVGKTTAIRSLLARKPVDAYWAVVVNEFGEIGIDGAALQTDADSLQVVEVPGGCICCATSPMLRTRLVQLLRVRRPDRLLIESSGLGHASGLIDLLREPGLREAIRLAAVITLLDPRQLDDPRYTTHDTWRDQIQVADVLIANKADRADAAQIDRFHTLATASFPPKAATITACQGVFDLGLLDAAREVTTATPYRPVRLTPANDPATVQEGHIWPAEVVFNAERLAVLFQSLDRLVGPALLRAKGVFHTDHGWLLFNWANGEVDAVPIAWRRDSRFEALAATALPAGLDLPAHVDATRQP